MSRAPKDEARTRAEWQRSGVVRETLAEEGARHMADRAKAPHWKREVRMAGGDFHLAAQRRVNLHGSGRYVGRDGRPLHGGRFEAISLARSARREPMPIFVEYADDGSLIVAAGVEAVKAYRAEEAEGHQRAFANALAYRMGGAE